MLLEKKFLPKPLGPEQFRSVTSRLDAYSEEKLQARWSQPDALVLLGEGALNKGDAEFAYRCMRRAVEIKPNHPKAWLWLGLISEKPDEAISCYQQAVVVLEEEIRKIQQNQPQNADEKHHPELTLEAKTAMQRFLLQKAQDGIAFEKKRLLSSLNTHKAVARVRLAAPTRVNTWSNCEDESGKVVRRFWGWAQLLGFAGIHYYKIRFPDGLEGYANDNKTLIDIVPINEQIDKRNIIEDPASVQRLLLHEVLTQLQQSPQVAISLILKRVPELENKLELPSWWWYEKAGDLAYLSGDVDTANRIWAKADVRPKLRYLFAKKPEDIGPNLIRACAEDFLMTYVVPLTKPEFYLSAPDPDDPYDKGRNRVQRTYPEEIAAAVKGEILEWQSEHNTAFLDFVVAQINVEPYPFFFGFPESTFQSQQLGYVPRVGREIREMVDKWRTDAENQVRRAHGLPLRGSLISETLLYETIKRVLNGMEVVRQHEAWKYLPWLPPQHVDIFVPQLNLGIEYQGEQHFRPVELFGGEGGFQATVARDKRKRELFKQHGVALLYVKPEDDMSPNAVKRLLEPFLQGRVSTE